MSQQEFQSQQYTDSVQENIQESEARPYYWSTKPNTGNMPKNEHPANFEDSIGTVPPIPPYSYQAQDRASQQAYTSPQAQQQKSRRNFSPDGDAMEHGYRPYRSYNSYSGSVPPWARPQGGNKGARVILFVILGFALVKPLLALLTAFLLLAGVALVGMVILAGLALVSMFIVFGIMGRRPPLGLFRSRRGGWW